MGFDSLRPVISWIIGAAVAAISAWLLEHVQLEIPKEIQEHGTQFLTFVIWILVSKNLARYINPGDAASKHLIPLQKEIVAQQKILEKTGENSLTKNNNVQV